MFGNGRIFISHTHQDNQLCEPLLAALDAWQLDYWFDITQLAAGQEFPERIQQAIRERDILVRICSPAANRSIWLEREVAMARVLRSARPRSRMVINLVLQPGYDATGDAYDDYLIDATKQSEAEWLAALRTRLGVPSRERRLSRRTVIGLGVTSAAALGASAFAARVLLAPIVAQARYVPLVKPQVPTPQTGTGHLLWHYRNGINQYQPTSLALAGDSLILVTGGADSTGRGTLSLAAKDGTLRWGQSVSISGYASPTVVGDKAYVIAINGTYTANSLVALSVADGTQAQSITLESTSADATGFSYASSVTVSGTTLFARYKNAFVAADSVAGAVLWWQGLPINDSYTTELYNAIPAPVVVNGAVYVCGDDGSVQALQAATGAVIWATPVAKRRISATPAYANGLLYVGAEDGFVYAVDVTTGAVRWHQQLNKYLPDINTASTDDQFVTSQPIVANGVVYVGGGSITGIPPISDTNNLTDTTTDQFLALDAATGALKWQINPSSYAFGTDQTIQRKGIQCTPVLNGNTIYVTAAVTSNGGLYREVLYAIEITDGSARWSYVAPGGSDFPSSPALGNGVVYWASSAGDAYALSV